MIIQNAPPGTIRAALRYPAFRRLLSALAVSQVGDWLYNLALVVLVYDRTHSPLWVGVTTAARVAPFVALGPLGGVLADRFDRRRIMIASDVIRLVLMLLLAVVAATGLPILLAPAIAALATAASAPYLPCVSAVIPRMVRDDDLLGANAARSAVTGLGVIAGPALGGILLLLGSPAIAIAVNSLTFGLSALAVLAIGPGDVFRVTQSADRPAGLVRQVAQGAAALRAHPEALRLVGADIMCSVVYGTQTVLLLMVSRQIGLGTQGYGYLFAGIGAGGLVGTALASRASRSSHPRWILAAALAAVGLPMPLLAVTHWPAVAIMLAGLTGTGALLVEILTDTCLQRVLDEDVLGRAYGLALPAAIGGIATGALIAPVLAGALGVSGALLSVGAAVLGYAVVVLHQTRAMPGTAQTAQPAAAVDAPAQ
jgi:predicted MFS family arabinose efflux permease